MLQLYKGVEIKGGIQSPGDTYTCVRSVGRGPIRYRATLNVSMIEDIRAPSNGGPLSSGCFPKIQLTSFLSM
jgi:hypothetical protein